MIGHADAGNVIILARFYSVDWVNMHRGTGLSAVRYYCEDSASGRNVPQSLIPIAVNKPYFFPVVNKIMVNTRLQMFGS